MSFLEESLRATATELYSATDDHHVTVAQFEELGWSELYEEEPKAAVGVLAEMQGTCLGISRLLEMTMATQLGGVVDVSVESLAIPLHAVALSGLDDVSHAVVLVGGPNRIVVPVETDGGVELHRGEAKLEPVKGLDPAAQLRRIVSFTSSEVIPLEEGVWERAVALASLELAEETLGVVNAELAMAVDHVINRHQFGVPLGTFQAVQHRLADVHVAREAARSVLDLAWESRDPAYCAAGLGAARRAFVAARIHCHQVMGAMGFTWEHRQHWFLRRGMALENFLDHRPALAAAVDTVISSNVRTEIWS